VGLRSPLNGAAAAKLNDGCAEQARFPSSLSSAQPIAPFYGRAYDLRNFNVNLAVLTGTLVIPTATNL